MARLRVTANTASPAATHPEPSRRVALTPNRLIRIVGRYDDPPMQKPMTVKPIPASVQFQAWSWTIKGRAMPSAV